MQPHAPQQKKSNVWLWVGLGCLGLLLVGAGVIGAVMYWGFREGKAVAEKYKNNPAMATAEMVAAMNPDIEVVSSDESAGTMTLRNKKTNETVTVNMNDARDGKFSFTATDAQGQQSTMSYDQQGGNVVASGPGGTQTTTFGSSSQVPAWIPSYPGATTEGVYATTGSEQNAGTFSATTTDGLDQVFAFYKQQLESSGYKVNETRYSGGGADGGMVVGESADGKRTLSFILASENGKTKVGGTYSEKVGG